MDKEVLDGECTEGMSICLDAEAVSIEAIYAERVLRGSHLYSPIKPRSGLPP
jgi:hypothetical protein